jgi:hypothetical protein
MSDKWCREMHRWDKKRLEPGTSWEDGFVNGLFQSCIFICVMSRDAINSSSSDNRNFTKLQKGSPCDNVLLEWRMALDLQKLGLLARIYPVGFGMLRYFSASYMIPYNNF